MTAEAETLDEKLLPRDIKTLSQLLNEMDRELFGQEKATVTIPAYKSLAYQTWRKPLKLAIFDMDGTTLMAH